MTMASKGLPLMQACDILVCFISLGIEKVQKEKEKTKILTPSPKFTKVDPSLSVI